MIAWTQRLPFYNQRYHSLIVGLIILMLCLLMRLYHLQNSQTTFLQQQGKVRSVRKVSLPAKRGVISDRRGYPLAVSTPAIAVWANPKLCDFAQNEWLALANFLDMAVDELMYKIVLNKDKTFVYVQRQISPDLQEDIKNLGLTGVYVKAENRRYYPEGEATAHLVGLTDIDGQGLEGVEYAFEHSLSGINGTKQIVQDRLGREIEVANNIDVIHGNSVQLTIDKQLQYLVFRELQHATTIHQALNGSAVVVDVHTGDILAMANYPSYNPNNKIATHGDNLRNLAVTDYFEPGSALKSFSMASVLENTNTDINGFINTNPGKLWLSGGIVKDLHNYGEIPIKQVLRYSSNVAISKMVLQLSATQLWDSYYRFGFGERSNIGLPGESLGVLPLPRNEQSFVLSTMAFGYGVGVTTLQLAQAYAILGAKGVKNELRLTMNQPGHSIRVLSAKVADNVLDMLVLAAEHEGSNARVSGYMVAGKTGTARKLSQAGYLKDKHRAVFGGVIPADNPRFAIVVTLNQPSAGKYYSNQVAAPVFAKIASESMRLFNVAPSVVK